jgi:hypothetical protein
MIVGLSAPEPLRQQNEKRDRIRARAHSGDIFTKAIIVNNRYNKSIKI